jgi:hypothetical protein
MNGSMYGFRNSITSDLRVQAADIIVLRTKLPGLSQVRTAEESSSPSLITLPRVDPVCSAERPWCPHIANHLLQAMALLSRFDVVAHKVRVLPRYGIGDELIGCLAK